MQAAIGENFLDLAIGGIVRLTEAIQSIDVEAIVARITTFRDNLVQTFQNIRPQLQPFIDIFNTVLSTWQNIFNTIIPVIVSFIQNLIQQFAAGEFNGAIQTFVGYFEFVSNTIQSILNVVVPFIAEQIGRIIQYWQENGDQIIEAVTNAWNIIRTVFETVLPIIQLAVQIAWNAIQNIISGAIDIILGVVDVFVGLFTGDWQKLWEGIQGILSGAINVIIGVLNLSFLGSIRRILTNLVTTGVNLIRNFGTQIVNFFRNFITNANNLVSGFVTRVVTFFRNLTTQGLNVFTNGFRNIVNRFSNFASDVITQISGLPGRFVQIGKDILSGFINGFRDSVAGAVSVVTGFFDDVVQTARDVLDWNSPSRVFMAAGSDSVLGYRLGVENNSASAIQAVSDMFEAVTDVTRRQVQRASAEANEIIYQSNERNARNIANIQKEASDELVALELETARELQQARTDANTKNASGRRALNKRIREIEEREAEQRKDINAQAEADIAEERSKRQAQALQSILDYNREKVALGEQSAIQEAVYLRRSLQYFAENTAERNQLQVEYRNSVQRLNDEILSVNSDFEKEFVSINDRLSDSLQKLNDDYDQQFSRLTERLAGFNNTFESFNVGDATSITTLGQSLATQVDALEEFGTLFEQLEQRGLNQGVLDELAELGPRSLPQLRAFVEATDVELNEYSQLYERRLSEARNIATNQLEELRADYNRQAQQLTAEANIELSNLQVEWQTAIRNITDVTQNEFVPLEQIGQNAATNLLNGLTSVESSIVSTAQRIAQSVQTQLQSAFDINGKGYNQAVNPLRNASVTSNGIIGNAVNNVAQTIRGGGASASNQQQITSSPVYLDGQMVGEIIHETVSLAQGRDTSISSLMRGVSR